ncbi:MAG: NAD(P)-dependent oxidoreductase [Mucilaginibacter polytrichastri]|nr:NAD(P)-dependent oxidoreductase [Mucilaginibacter polytrichastri]
MKILVTGSSGHLGEALMRSFVNTRYDAVGADLLPSAFTRFTGNLADPAFVSRCMHGVDAVIHTATLHKPHVGTHSRQDFVDTNITGTLNLLEEAVKNNVWSFVFTSTTSAFGDALTPQKGSPAAWISEEVIARPKNIYGVTKTAAEDLCRLFHRNQKLPCIILRTSRFFPEDDDNKQVRAAYTGENAKANELLYRRVDTADVVSAHILAMEKATQIGFGRYIISGTSPFSPDDLDDLHADAPSVVRRYFPEYEILYSEKGWRMFPHIDRVYVNDKAREELGWQPHYDFAHVLKCLKTGADFVSPLARTIGAKGYHAEMFSEGPYPMEGREQKKGG